MCIRDSGESDCSLIYGLQVGSRVIKACESHWGNMIDGTDQAAFLDENVCLFEYMGTSQMDYWWCQYELSHTKSSCGAQRTSAKACIAPGAWKIWPHYWSAPLKNPDVKSTSLWLNTTGSISHLQGIWPGLIHLNVTQKPNLNPTTI